jgi:GT2 family glycosyltransferase
MELVTIGIPTIEGREHVLMTCLASLLGQTHTQWNLIICSTNLGLKVTDRNDPAFINAFLASIAQLGHEVTILHDEVKQGPGFAVQKILDATKTPLLLRVDDDVILTPMVCEKLLETHVTDPKNIAAISSPVNGFGVPPVEYQRYWRGIEAHLGGNGTLEKLNDNFVHHSCQEKRVVVEVDFLSGYCILLDKEKTIKVGGYVDELSPHHHKEDWYGTIKLRAAGYRLLLRADSFAYHRHYGLDESDRYRSARSRIDHALFKTFKEGIVLDPARKFGIVDYVP